VSFQIDGRGRRELARARIGERDELRRPAGIGDRALGRMQGAQELMPQKRRGLLLPREEGIPFRGVHLGGRRQNARAIIKAFLIQSV
jgi:hypothetical protein